MKRIEASGLRCLREKRLSGVRMGMHYIWGQMGMNCGYAGKWLGEDGSRSVVRAIQDINNASLSSLKWHDR